VAVRAQTLVGTRIFYAITYTISGVPAQCTIPSDTRLVANDTPRIATLYENVSCHYEYDLGKSRLHSEHYAEPSDSENANRRLVK
jgi:hypothetical protein